MSAGQARKRLLFLLQLLGDLRKIGTIPAIDYSAYPEGIGA